MFDSLLHSNFGGFHFAILIIATVFIIPAGCMLASAIKNKYNYEIYATGEVAVTAIMLVSFLLSSISSLSALVTLNGNDSLLFALSLTGGIVFLIFFFIYISVISLRKRAYGEENVTGVCDAGDVVCGIVEIIAAIFEIFLGH